MRLGFGVIQAHPSLTPHAATHACAGGSRPWSRGFTRSGPWSIRASISEAQSDPQPRSVPIRSPPHWRKKTGRGPLGGQGVAHIGPPIRHSPFIRSRPSATAGNFAGPLYRSGRSGFRGSRCALRCRPGSFAAGRATHSHARFRSGQCPP